MILFKKKDEDDIFNLIVNIFIASKKIKGNPAVWMPYAPSGYKFVGRYIGYNEDDEYFTTPFDIYYNSKKDFFFFNTRLNPIYKTEVATKILTYNLMWTMGNTVEKWLDYVENDKYEYWNNGIEAFKEMCEETWDLFAEDMLPLNYKTDWTQIGAYYPYVGFEDLRIGYYYVNYELQESYTTIYKSYFWNKPERLVTDENVWRYIDELMEIFGVYEGEIYHNFANDDGGESFRNFDYLKAIWDTYWEPDDPDDDDDDDYDEEPEE